MLWVKLVFLSLLVGVVVFSILIVFEDWFCKEVIKVIEVIRVGFDLM